MLSVCTCTGISLKFSFSPISFYLLVQSLVKLKNTSILHSFLPLKFHHHHQCEFLCAGCFCHSCDVRHWVVPCSLANIPHRFSSLDDGTIPFYYLYFIHWILSRFNKSHFKLVSVDVLVLVVLEVAVSVLTPSSTSSFCSSKTFATKRHNNELKSQQQKHIRKDILPVIAGGIKAQKKETMKTKHHQQRHLLQFQILLHAMVEREQQKMKK